MSRRKAKRPPPVREVALEIVARRMLSLAELRKRLERRGYGTDEIDEATELAHAYGYVDDAKLAGAVVREAVRTARGPRWVRSTLLRRGVPDELARGAETLALEGATDRIRDVVARRFGDALDDSGRQKAYRYLLNRGFSPEAVMEVLDEAR
jgi:SOS response regulatory protein OraA/RecX